MNIEDLMDDNGPGQDLSPPETDPLIEEDALYEAQLLDVRYNALRMTAALLIELRTTLEFPEGDTGVLIARRARQLSWTSETRATERTAWTVVGSSIGRTDGEFHLRLYTMPNALLELHARSATFMVGAVPGLPKVIPDYQDSDETVRAGLPTWGSKFAAVQATSLNVTESS